MSALKNGLSSRCQPSRWRSSPLLDSSKPHAILMMAAATAGGYAGAPLARAPPKHLVRGLIALIGFGMSAIFFWRLFPSCQ